VPKLPRPPFSASWRWGRQSACSAACCPFVLDQHNMSDPSGVSVTDLLLRQAWQESPPAAHVLMNGPLSQAFC
jgi:hypothetical protein